MRRDAAGDACHEEEARVNLVDEVVRRALRVGVSLFGATDDGDCVLPPAGEREPADAVPSSPLHDAHLREPLQDRRVLVLADRDDPEVDAPPHLLQIHRKH